MINVFDGCWREKLYQSLSEFIIKVHIQLSQQKVYDQSSEFPISFHNLVAERGSRFLKRQLRQCERERKDEEVVYKMAKNWNIASVKPLDDTNYFLWSEKIEGILRAKNLWKKVMGVKPSEKSEEDDVEYAVKFRQWNKWDDTIMLQEQ